MFKQNAFAYQKIQLFTFHFQSNKLENEISYQKFNPIHKPP